MESYLVMPIGIYTRKYPIWNKGLTKETDSRIAEMAAKVGRKGRISPMKGKTKETDQRVANNLGYTGKHHTQEYKDKRCVDQKKLWQNPSYAEKQMLRCVEGNHETRPNRTEKKIIEILKSLHSNIRYVGDGTHWISGKNPDFVDKTKMLIIEVTNA